MTPEIERQRAGRDAARNVLTVLARSMWIADMSLGDVDRRNGWRTGVARGILVALANGEDVSLRQIAQFAHACGERLSVQLAPLRKGEDEGKAP